MCRCERCGVPDPTAGRPVGIEIVAPANHRKAVRAEVAKYGDRFREDAH